MSEPTLGVITFLHISNILMTSSEVVVYRKHSMSHPSRTLRRALLMKAAVGVVVALLVSGCTPSAAAPYQAVQPVAAAVPPRTAATPIVEASPTVPPPDVPDTRPNVVLITTDDQSLREMKWMPRTRRLLGAAGVRFSESLSPHPLCCPARAEILTGQYAQNNGVRGNKLPLGGYARLRSNRTLATWLDAARYQTAFVGKYLNGYKDYEGGEPGWDVFDALVKNVYHYFNYTVLENGSLVQYPGVHSADMVGQKTVEQIEEFSKQPEPFFVWASQVAPHGACLPSAELSCWSPPVPAARHKSLFGDAVAPSVSDPAFNERDMSDKPRWIRGRDPVSVPRVNNLFRNRIRSLQAVDESVADTVAALERTGELENTVIIFTSDNGFLLGEHRYVGKDAPYEQALQVPLLIRGPGIPAGGVRDQTVATIDLAPTILAVANARANIPVDGRNLLPLIRRPRNPGYDTVLIQSGPRTAQEVRLGWRYRGVRTERYTYVRYLASGFRELYDRAKGPTQMSNVARLPAYKPVLRELDRRTTVLGRCSGASCRRDFGPVPPPNPFRLR